MYQYRFRYSFVLLAFVLAFLGGCAKEELDIYKRPANLEPPIYQTLQNKGNFKTLLGVIDKSGYQHTLSSAGYWTFFAPNDEAFAKYFQKSGLSLAALDSTKARSLVQGMLVYNSFLKERLDDYQDAIGWVPSKAFRRRTAYYTGFYDDVNITGTSLKAVAGNRNGFNYVPDDNNNKYISYFINDYFAAKGLSATDYNYFFPDATYSGFNVMNAKVLNQDIVAENGTVHEVDNVITVQPSIDEYLKSKSEYSEFRKLYEKYMVGYSPNAVLTNKYQILTGKNTPVFVKGYSNTLAFSPANENFMKLSDNDGQQDCWSVFVPTNDVLLPYIKNVLLENYASLDVVPQQVIIDFLNAHMWGTSVWPSRFKTTFNGLGEEARFDPASNVVEKKVLSNGFFYGTNKVQESNLFSTVFAKSYLDPKYSIMTRLLNMDLRSVILNPKLKYTVFLMSDAAINAAGYDVKLLDNGTLEWGYTAPGIARVTGDANRTRLLRIVGTTMTIG